jgi:hypothetical protein
MSRIATITAVLSLAVAPAAFAGSGVQPNINDIGKQAAPAVSVTSGQDLRSPDAADVPVAASPAPQAAPADDGGLSTWVYLAIVAAALGACALLIVVLRSAFAFGRPQRA